ncbi:mitochondrial enolase superfamily member 1 [Grus japonensis]|uniref:Mitochondrial enolase superfamily member 1 n=1 Tax=Grus japonensis TaxID=30415 RepID=A0ABC9W143_GRUJA
MGPDGMHPQVLSELADVIARPLLIIFVQSRQLGEVPENWRKANVTPNFKKGKKEEPGIYKLVSLTLIPGKMTEQLILETISRHMKDKKGRAVDIVYLDFSKDFVTVSHKILIKKLTKNGLDEQTVRHCEYYPSYN